MSEITNRLGVHTLMDEVISRLEKAFSSFSPEVCEIPVRAGFHYDNPRPGLVEWMPCYRRGKSVVMKMVGYHPQNPVACGLPTILSTYSLFDASTGHLQAIADGNFLTALRTGAASAIASRLMANVERGVVGLIGTGAQAMSQLHALSRCFQIKSVMLFDADSRVAESFAGRIASLGLDSFEVSVCPVAEVVSESEILCVATSVGINEGPVFEKNIPIRPGLHINAVGSDLPGKTELPLPLLQRGTVVPDFREQAEREGECQQLNADEIGPDLPSLLKNPDLLPGISDSLSIFDSTGFALEDLIAMEMILELATSLGIGSAMEIESSATDPHNPYEFLNLAPEVLRRVAGRHPVFA